MIYLATSAKIYHISKSYLKIFAKNLCSKFDNNKSAHAGRPSRLPAQLCSCLHSPAVRARLICVPPAIKAIVGQLMHELDCPPPRAS